MCLLVLVTIAMKFEESGERGGLEERTTRRVDSDKEGGRSIGPSFLEAVRD